MQRLVAPPRRARFVGSIGRRLHHQLGLRSFCHLPDEVDHGAPIPLALWSPLYLIGSTDRPVSLTTSAFRSSIPSHRVVLLLAAALATVAAATGTLKPPLAPTSGPPRSPAPPAFRPFRTRRSPRTKSTFASASRPIVATRFVTRFKLAPWFPSTPLPRSESASPTTCIDCSIL